MSAEQASRFRSELQVQWLPDGRWRLVAELQYWSAVANRLIIVPAGFTTDFASVPRLPVVYLLAGNTAHRPAVVHDWLYQSKVLGSDDDAKELADRVFHEAMEVDQVDAVRTELMTEAVVLFGWTAWAGSGAKRQRLNPGLGGRTQPVEAP